MSDFQDVLFEIQAALTSSDYLHYVLLPGFSLGKYFLRQQNKTRWLYGNLFFLYVSYNF